jgi:hypothetical protein
MLLIRCISIGGKMMKQENILASYLIHLGEEVLKLLLAKGAAVSIVPYIKPEK